jgi:outer membrane protein assembly factor BamB
MNPIVFDGVVYVVANGDQFLGFDVETGEQVWQATVPGTVGWRSAAIAEGRIFITDDAGMLHAFDLASGALVWSTEYIAALRVPAYRGGMLFIPGSDGRTTAVSAQDGTVVWQTEPAPSGYESFNLVVTDEAIISIVWQSPAHALDPATGDLLWTANVNAAVDPDPHAGGDTFYLQGIDSRFSAFSMSDGSFIATTGPYMTVGSTAAISGNMLFLSGLGGTIRAFGPVASTTREIIASPPAERTPESAKTGSPSSATPGAA